MNTAPILWIVCLVAAAASNDTFFGNKQDGDQLLVRDKVWYNAWPLKKRIGHYSFEDPERRTIKAILCYDYEHSNASVSIAEGGIGHSFVNLRLKSQRSYRLNYAIEVYA